MAYKIGVGCVGCGACAGMCPMGAIKKTEGGKFAIDANVCMECGACVGACPMGAIAKQ